MLTLIFFETKKGTLVVIMSVHQSAVFSSPVCLVTEAPIFGDYIFSMSEAAGQPLLHYIGSSFSCWCYNLSSTCFIIYKIQLIPAHGQLVGHGIHLSFIECKTHTPDHMVHVVICIRQLCDAIEFSDIVVHCLMSILVHKWGNGV